LGGEAGGGGGVGPEPADVEGSEVGGQEGGDRSAGWGDPVAGGVADNVGVQGEVVEDDRDGIPGEDDVELDRGDVEVEGPSEALKGVFRIQPACAPMPLKIGVRGLVPSGSRAEPWPYFG
jgi:hypothetical protein